MMSGLPTGPDRHLTVWTEQHPAVLDRLRETGEFRADGRRVPKVVRPVFGWMRRQMSERIEDATRPARDLADCRPRPGTGRAVRLEVHP
jgi:hypothetical protein